MKIEECVCEGEIAAFAVTGSPVQSNRCDAQLANSEVHKVTTWKVMSQALAVMTVLSAVWLVPTEISAAEAEPSADARVPRVQAVPENTASEQRQKPRALLNPPNPGDVWWMREGKGYTICEALYMELRQYTPKQLGACAVSVAFQLPGMKELDGWRELDPRDHKDLYKRLTQYAKVGVNSYFTGEYFDLKKFDEDTLERKFQLFLEDGGQMRVNALQVFRHPLADPVTTYNRLQTVLELRIRSNKAICPDAPSLTDLVRTFYVTEDLSGPSPDIKQHEASVASSARLVEYKGVLRLLYGNRGLSIHRQTKDGMMHSYCEIQPLKWD